jgi:hypothetical protein
MLFPQVIVDESFQKVLVIQSATKEPADDAEKD